MTGFGPDMTLQGLKAVRAAYDAALNTAFWKKGGWYAITDEVRGNAPAIFEFYKEKTK